MAALSIGQLIWIKHVTDIQVRSAQAEDFDAVMRLYRQLQPDDPVLADGSDRAVFDQILESPHLDLIVLQCDHSVVATCYLNIIPNITRRASPYAIIENVVTDRALRKRGLGRLLLQDALARAWQTGCYKVMLQTGSRQVATHAFYRACGFSGDDKTAYVARPADRFRDPDQGPG